MLLEHRAVPPALSQLDFENPTRPVPPTFRPYYTHGTLRKRVLENGSPIKYLRALQKLKRTNVIEHN